MMTDNAKRIEPPFADQKFDTLSDWVNFGHLRLTDHPDYNNTEHSDRRLYWRGHHFTALCFDSLGRRCREGADFMRAVNDMAFPVWWIWPDQIITLFRNQSDEIARLEKTIAEQEHDLNAFRKRLEMYVPISVNKDSVLVGTDEVALDWGNARLSRAEKAEAEAADLSKRLDNVIEQLYAANETIAGMSIAVEKAEAERYQLARDAAALALRTAITVVRTETARHWANDSVNLSRAIESRLNMMIPTTTSDK